MKFIGYLRGLSLGYALTSENRAFEVSHVHDVAYYSEKLAFERGLDQNIALAIAYGHDLGRTKLGVVGKNHARVSARFMKALMAASEFDLETQDMIGYAIKKHNLKGKCHVDYAELIKDADALAHLDEGLIADDNRVERYRTIISNMIELSIKVAPLELWCEQFESHRMTFLKNMSHLDFFKKDATHWIHEQRKNVRKLRSMIWYLKIGITDDRFDDLDNLLKLFFSDLSDARMIQVQIDHLKTMSNSQSKLSDDAKLQILKERLQLELDRIESHLTSGFYEALIRVFSQTFDLASQKFDDPLRNQSRWIEAFTNYLQKATETHPENLKELHKLRIQGKKFKYMSELGLLCFSSQTVVSVIDDLHDYIGTLNDLGDMKKMKKWQSLYEETLVNREIEKVRKCCKSELFFLVKLAQMIKNRHLLIGRLVDGDTRT